MKAKCQERLFELCLRRGAINRILVSDDTLLEHYRKKGSSLLRRIRYLPEIADLPKLSDKGDSKGILKIRTDAHVVLCYGALSRRKGIPELLEGLEDSNCPSSVVALLVGETDEEMRRLLEGEEAQVLRNKQRLFWQDGFLDDEQTALAFSASDSAWLGYHNFENSSGFLWQAARAGLPPISCAKGLIGYWTRSCELGQSIDPAKSNEVGKALHRVASNSELRAQWAANCIQEAKSHTTESFGRTVCDALAKKTDSTDMNVPVVSSI
jgi:glycosyltransferase involved in cell wall biosynthesis